MAPKIPYMDGNDISNFESFLKTDPFELELSDQLLFNFFHRYTIHIYDF